MFKNPRIHKSYIKQEQQEDSMTFQYKNMSVMAYANGFTLWHYNDPKITSNQIDFENFFNTIHNLCARGDKFMINFQDCYIEVIVTNIEGEKVTTKEIVRIIY